MIFNIVYPSLVEQSYQFMCEQGIEVTKAEVYKMMIQEGLLTETGNPTNEAIRQGLVTEFNQAHATLAEFKKEYPVFKHYSNEEFTQQEGIWYVSQKIIADIEQILAKNNCDRDLFIQIETYFNFRNYDNPHGSIAETKGVFHPWYTPYPDEAFQIVDGKVAVSKDILEDMARRVEKGELDMDNSKLYHLIEQLEGGE
ncbi:hypothetical protein ACFJYA_08145 [Enterococcus faecalis]